MNARATLSNGRTVKENVASLNTIVFSVILENTVIPLSVDFHPEHGGHYRVPQEEDIKL
jgi:hypothetical protein